MKKAKSVIFLGAILLLAAFLVFAQNRAQAGDSDDAIAVRIVPNPNHYSVYRWYDSQGFSGSPQALSVDGYEAVRDGRTVYVNAANIKDKTIYTNIYIISYNQDPAEKTVDILGQLVKYWKFNNGLVEQSNPSPRCAISSLPCSGDSDCGSGQYCASSTIAADSCQLKTAVNCATDDDCPQNFFCDSIKAKIIRDLKRIGRLEELKESLFAYKTTHGYYPRLQSGSYISGHTVSVWPSWAQSFLSELSTAQDISDPINRLGACSGFDKNTCWNKDTQRFVFDPQSGYLMLPAGSYGLVYKTDANGSNYNLCAVMETRENTPALNFQFSPNNPAGSDCVMATGIISGGTSNNNAPFITDAYLTGEADQEFNGSIKVADSEGNPLSWQFNTGGENWAGWSAAPILKNTSNASQKKVYAAKAGAPKVYNAQLTVSDGQGGVLATSVPITIINTKPFIESGNGEYVLDQKTPFSYSFYFSDSNLSNPASAYTVTKVSGPSNFNLLSFPSAITPAGVNRYKVTYSGTIPTTNKFYADAEYFYRITVKDKYNSTTTKDFKITIKIEAPSLSFSCPIDQRVNKTYSCFLGYAVQGNHSLVYSGTNLPAGLVVSTSSAATININNDDPVSYDNRLLRKLAGWFGFAFDAEAATSGIGGNGGASTIISGDAVSYRLSGTPTAVGSKQITIKAVNEYGASSTKIFTLNINNYCGDGQKQEPNTEGRGGMYNDGYEDCDRNAGLSLNNQGKPVVSNDPLLQYGCTTFNATTPYPIPNNNYCVFKSPIDNGGYCGDGYCQLQVVFDGETVNVETASNCAQDCDPSCVPNCIGKVCGNDGCGGSCGDCDLGQQCNNGRCEASCIPDCAGKVCGPDGCGGVCLPNMCASGLECVSGRCVSTCTPDCDGKTCGPDGCGGSCGTCVSPKVCKDNGVCCQSDCHGCVGIISAQNWQICGGACCDPLSERCCNQTCIPKNQSCNPIIIDK